MGSTVASIIYDTHLLSLKVNERAFKANLLKYQGRNDSKGKAYPTLSLWQEKMGQSHKPSKWGLSVTFIYPRNLISS